MSPSIMVQCKTRQGTKTDNRKTDTGYQDTTLVFVFYTDVWWWNQEGIKKISQLHQHIFSKSGDKLWPDLCRCRRFIFGREHFAKTSKHHHPTPHRLSAQEFQSILTNFLICFKCAIFLPPVKPNIFQKHQNTTIPPHIVCHHNTIIYPKYFNQYLIPLE